MDTQQPEFSLDADTPAEAPAPASRQPTTVPITTADFASLRDSKALSAFIIRRMEQLTRYGHSPVKDLQLPLCTLPREAYGRIQGAIDHIGYGADPTAERLGHALRNIETAGALLLAAHDRISSELAQMGHGNG